jgi:NRAMP (natural resistance-associated macrophage protein)-like metal ion transporter
MPPWNGALSFVWCRLQPKLTPRDWPFSQTWLELFVGMLVGIIGLCFMLECVSSSPDMSKTIAGMIIPRVPAGSENIAVGLLGAVVMPHNLFLQSALVQSRPVRRSKTSIEYACLYTSVETTIALVTSFFVNLSVMLVASASFAPSWCEAKQQVCQGGTGERMPHLAAPPCVKARPFGSCAEARPLVKMHH